MKALNLPTSRILRVCILLLLLASPSAPAFEAPLDETEIWLLTYGPGELYWQRFGHNAIWIRDPSLKLDHSFNFGFFDFEQEDFFWRFLQGRMLYFSAAQPAREEFADYIDDNRSIRAQKLDFPPEQKLKLVEYLLTEIRPENRDYLYDYYRHNCSTRVRDALNLAMDDELLATFSTMPASGNWRDHTRRLTEQDFWLYLGLETGLGTPVDANISQWDEMFIPGKLAHALTQLVITRDGMQAPLILEDVVLYQSTADPPLATAHAWWPRYLMASLLLILGVWLLSRFMPAGFPLLAARAWLVLAGLAGLVLLFFWLGTDHDATRPNFNVLVLNPLYILPVFRRGWEKPGLLVIVGLSLLALLMALLPAGQYNLDVLAAFVPLNLAAAYVLYLKSVKR